MRENMFFCASLFISHRYFFTFFDSNNVTTFICTLILDSFSSISKKNFPCVFCSYLLNLLMGLLWNVLLPKPFLVRWQLRRIDSYLALRNLTRQEKKLQKLASPLISETHKNIVPKVEIQRWLIKITYSNRSSIVMQQSVQLFLA